MGVIQTATAAPPIISARGVRKTFRMGDATLTVLKDADLDVRPGEFIAIEGRSGSGKSTLLHILGALDSYGGGSVRFNGRELDAMSPTERSRLRNREFGFVFQAYYLLPELNVLENTMLASMVEFSWLSFLSQRKRIRQRAMEMLTEMGLQTRARQRVAHLSGGERQRVAIARALMNKPRVLFADEPTGNLDFDTGRQIMDLLERLHRDAGQTIIMVTHDRSLARMADRVLVLQDGKLRPAE